MRQITRRGLAVWGVGTGAAAIGLGMNQVARANPADSASATRKPILVGANPAIQLFDDAGDPTAYLSCWRVDWSTHGRGDAIVLWRPDEVAVYGAARQLSLWLANHFVAHFPELDGQPWPKPRFHRRHVAIEVDLDRGMRARAGEVQATISGILDLRTFSTDEFPLDGIDHSLSMVLGPCETGEILRHGQAMPGSVQHSGTSDRPSSSAFVTDAEVWLGPSS
ncbi:MAG: hypothetical protein ACTH2Q_16850 [Propionibacteriaceae bacterium]